MSKEIQEIRHVVRLDDPERMEPEWTVVERSIPTWVVRVLGALLVVAAIPVAIALFLFLGVLALVGWIAAVCLFGFRRMRG